MAGRSPQKVFHHMETTLISAQGLKPPSSAANLRRMRTYAVVWVNPSAKLRTLVDSVGGENPTWNEKFLFRVPAGFLAGDSPSALHIEVYAVGLLVDSLLGTVDLLVGNHRLLSRPLGEPSFVAVGIRRPSGRFHGVLNIGAALLPRHHVPALAAEALARGGGDAICYRVLMGEEGASHKIRRQRLSAPEPAETSAAKPDDTEQRLRVLREWNAGRGSGAADVEKAKEESRRRRSSLDPTDQNFGPTKATRGGRS